MEWVLGLLIPANKLDLSFLYIDNSRQTAHCVFPPPLLRELIEHEIHSCGWSLLGDVTGDYKVVFSRPFLSCAPNVPNAVGWYSHPLLLCFAFLFGNRVAQNPWPATGCCWEAITGDWKAGGREKIFSSCLWQWQGIWGELKAQAISLRVWPSGLWALWVLLAAESSESKGCKTCRAPATSAPCTPLCTGKPMLSCFSSSHSSTCVTSCLY